MATVSPTPAGQGSQFTSMGRRTSARQALRRPPSRSQMSGAASGTASKRTSNAAAAGPATAASDSQQQYAALHDSSDDEMPIPMKLSALTKALLSDGASAPEGTAAAAAAAAAQEAAAAAAAASSTGTGMATRRRSALNRSTSSAAGAETDGSSQLPSQNDRPGVRQTRRHVRAGSVQASGGVPSSASRPTSPPALLSGNSSPAPRKRVVRLSTTTPAGGMGPVQPPIRRSLSASKHATRRGTAAAAEERGAELPPAAAAVSSIDAVMSTAAPSSAPAETINTPASAVRRVQIAVGSSGGRSASRATRLSTSSSSSALRTTRRTESAAGHHSDAEQAAPSHEEPPSTVGRPSSQHQQQMGSALRAYAGGSGSSAGTTARSGSRDIDPQQALQSSMRVKRVGKSLGGGFLSGPARRGRRRTSDEEGEGHSPEDMLQPHHDGDAGGLLMSSQESEANAMYSSQGAHSGSGSRSPYFDPYARGDRAATGSPVSGRTSSAQRASSLRSHASNVDLQQQQQPEMMQYEPAQQHEAPAPQQEPEQPDLDLLRRRSYRAEDVAAAPPPKAAPPPPPPVSSNRPNLPSAHDQENDLAYLGRSVKPLVVSGIAGLGDKEYNVNQIRPLRAALQPAVADVKLPSVSAAKPTSAAAPPVVSPERKVLSTISRNTPHRSAPPPPPPKMSVLETATGAPAGAAATAQAGKKPRILLKVNGRSYQRVDCVGRGGSGKVYKVTAENGKMFAMKRVSLENADESTIRGFMGEIDLLKKLSGVDRVIQLFDFEMNKEKQMLSLLMELGEMDLNSLLRLRQNPESAKMDPVFVRFYWKEMLECLQAVHVHDIVHSDLKPANFVLVQGRLKLIDFGIANAIQTEMTVNVHRETQVGTPSYMSPESLMDAQQYAFTANHHGAGGRPGVGGFLGAPKSATKLVKLGKPSDVWSLGCILYQMVYGLPPFGHIQNQMARCQAIITWTHTIDFPARGMGGTPVPPSLINTMKRCLNREQQLRPTCDELLSPMDTFLFPEAQYMSIGGGAECMPISEELLGRIIQSVVTRCRERMPTDAEAVSAWPAAYWSSVRRAVAAREEKQQ
ncbi:serine/threonineeeee-protein kinase TTK/MPS1 [Sporothrix schenckii 1099-18]|uniref:Serine/threonineeeee-protein kinase TTK/MPS1 n=1 Tax=Sporothrix schenckii 1099-18 TaxID=1397361 RepID=A0A0F2LZA3_SPOSC|nr:serine/threonineeeee-protein kinase TTK/MPS1 [Sporothrix schenckii 1099-18]KJR82797.1 serine/threonineeeee-protein kinase TTK/MPS1 [Sporothrix schenckii 1099-18]